MMLERDAQLVLPGRVGMGARSAQPSSARLTTPGGPAPVDRVAAAPAYLGDFELNPAEALSGDREWRAADILSRNPDVPQEVYARFIAGGLLAVQRDGSAGSWIQIGLVPAVGRRDELYGVLADRAAALLESGRIRNFFFMHKSPALRVRFESGPDEHDEVNDLVAGLAEEWRRQGVVSRVVSGVYEPESLLFGGPTSMAHVHRLFSIDSLVWLAFLRRSGSAAGPAWALSLALLRPLFVGLGIVGWEDLDVWDRVRWQTGRQLPDAMDRVKVQAATAGIRAAWEQPVVPPVALPVDDIRTSAAAWSEDYFLHRGALIGPREAAAFFIIFHWNRGGLPMLTQSLVAAALADRSVRP